MVTEILCVATLLLLIDTRRTIKRPTRDSTASSVVLDTSALIDGRIVDVVRSGFMQHELLIPKAVINELQLLADGRDAFKRERARVGLDMVVSLQQLRPEHVQILEKFGDRDELTDDVVLICAKQENAMVCTNDFNLNKVALTQGLVVLNVNELAQALRPKYLPGDAVQVKIIQKGETPNQGVGYMDDGTMVVVDGANKKQTTVDATVERFIQTKAGKMIFARVVHTSKK